MREKTMRLYVWTNYCPDYTGGLAFAIAENLEQAMMLVEKERGCKVYDWGTLRKFSLKASRAFCVSGGG